MADTPLRWLVEPHEGYLHVRMLGHAAEGPDAADRTVKLTAAVSREDVERAGANILADTRELVRRQPGLAQDVIAYNIVDELAARPYSRRLRRIAVLVAPDDLAHRDYVEDLAQNRGLDLRFFTVEAEALAWLTGSKPSDAGPAT